MNPTCASCGHDLEIHSEADETNRLPCLVIGCECTAFADADECVHSLDRAHCIYCGPLKDVPMTTKTCTVCKSGTWHRDDTGACLKCGSTDSTPFDPPISK